LAEDDVDTCENGSQLISGQFASTFSELSFIDGDDQRNIRFDESPFNLPDNSTAECLVVDSID